MAYVAPTIRSVGDAVTAADYNIMANDVIDHETRIKTGVEAYTTTQKNALTGVVAGTTVWDSTLASLQVYNGSAWVQRNAYIGNTTAIKCIQTGSTSVTTNGSGVATISTGISTVDFFAVTHGTHSSVGNISLGRSTASSGGTIYVQAFVGHTGAPYASQTITIDWMAVGNP